MTTYFTSDTHFDHSNIIRYSKRPFKNVSEMNETLIENWNKVVTNRDVVWHLGDFAMGNNSRRIADIYSQLNGQINFIFGNHDKRRALMTAAPKSLFRDLYKWNDPNSRQQVILCHYGMRVWEKHHHGTFHFYGHSHGSLQPFAKSVDVGVDSPYITGKPEYRPYSYEELKAFMDTRQIEVVDHHESSHIDTSDV